MDFPHYLSYTFTQSNFIYINTVHNMIIHIAYEEKYVNNTWQTTFAFLQCETNCYDSSSLYLNNQIQY